MIGERPIKKEEAIAILKELSANDLVQSSLVLIEQRSPDRNQLQIRGDFDRHRIELFLRKRNVSFKKNNDYLIVFKP